MGKKNDGEQCSDGGSDRRCWRLGQEVMLALAGGFPRDLRTRGRSHCRIAYSAFAETRRLRISSKVGVRASGSVRLRGGATSVGSERASKRIRMLANARVPAMCL
eukprot:6204812-Pleurochrysis_carterae.AAC.1